MTKRIVWVCLIMVSAIFPALCQVEGGRIETFTFTSKGTPTNGKIFLPASYNENKDLPAIYLIDFTEQHFKLATDEFEKVMEGVQKLQGKEALVVSLEEIPDVDAEPDSFQEHFHMFIDMTSYVDDTYTDNTSRTFIGKGSESGIVMMALFLEDPENPIFDNYIATDPSGLYGTALIELIESGDFPQNKPNKILHFSFTTSNDYNKCSRIIQLIEEAQYSWLEFESKYYKNSTYENTYPVSFAEGIAFIFEE